MHLSWADQDRIAKALLATYPDQDRLALSLEELRALIVALPDFADTPHPPGEAWLSKILWTWMRFAHMAEDEGMAEVFSSPCAAVPPGEEAEKKRRGS